MSILYLECAMGAAGDMLMGALLELHQDATGFLHDLNALFPASVSITAEPSKKCGILGTHVHVTVNGEEEGVHHAAHSGHAHGHHEHTTHTPHTHGMGMKEISEKINILPLPTSIKKMAQEIFMQVAEAESAVHGTPIQEIHFHELGTMDALCDIVGVCMLMEALAPEKVIVSPIHVGSGTVLCTHGIMPVPAPATALLLEGVPVYAGDIAGELCTPTGAAILKYFADQFAPMPPMAIEKVGYGMGTKDFAAANCVRAFWGNAFGEKTQGPNGTVTELSCNLDDMTGEAIAFACEILFAQGALDVFHTPIYMKKGRPGVLLTCLCHTTDADQMASLMLQHTSSLGIRRRDCTRYELARSVTEHTVDAVAVQVKHATGYGTSKSKLEYETLAAYSKKNNISMEEAKRLITSAVAE